VTTSVRTFSHDDAGNPATDNRSGTAYTYRYNNRGRLDELSTGATVMADCSYDGLERMAVEPEFPRRTLTEWTRKHDAMAPTIKQLELDQERMDKRARAS
jgi:hypothetical protein